MNFKKLLRTALAVAAVSVGIAGNASAAFFSHVGTTEGHATWDVDAAFNAPGTVVPYDSFDFHVDEGGTYKFLATARFDTMIILYAGGFDASAPTDHLIKFNDDILTPNTSGFVAELTAGVQYTFVLTGFNDSEYGAYTFSAGGPGNIIPGPVLAVPEPSAWLMLGLGMAGLGFAARRHPRNA
jgi:hypothetical protein